MNRAERHEALIRLHTAKLVHARLLGSHISTLLQPTRMNVHKLQKLINERTRK